MVHPVAGPDDLVLQRARLLFEDMAFGAVFQDRTGRIVLANPAARRILGLTTDQILGRTSFDPRWRAIREDGSDFSGDQHPSMVALRTGQPVRDVIMGIWRPVPGDQRWLRINASPQFRPGEAEPFEVFTAFDDITELKDLERALRRSEERFRIAAECSSDILYEWDLATQEVEYFGRTHYNLREGARASSAEWIARLHPDERDGMLAELADRLADGRPLARQHRLAGDDGRWRHILTRGQVIPDAHGVPRRWIGASSDITNHREAIESLRQTANLFEAVVEGSSDPIFVKSVDGRYLMANSACAARFDRPASHVLGKTNFDLTTRDIAERLQAHDAEVIAGGKAVTFEAIGPGSPGPRHYLVTKAPYRDASGAIIGIVGVARDLTELKSLEASYRQAQKMEAVGRLAGGVAHDFNNLLTIILGCVEELGAAGIATPHNCVAEIQAAAERATELTSQLLAFGRRQLLRPERLDPNALVTGLERLLKRVLRENIHLVVDLAPDAGTIWVDRGQMEQVLLNLVVNARDAMPNGGRLVIGTRGYSGQRSDDVTISVTDSGTGIPPDVLPNIFEPFFTTKDRVGTGLGLATAYGIVKQSGGEIRVESEVGRGTTFSIVLPRVAGDAPAAQRVREVDVAPSEGHILLVEDEERLRGLLQTVLERQGYTVTCCEDVPQARAWLESHDERLTLVLTDMVMPNGTGLELEQMARARQPQARLLFMSGYAEHVVGETGPLPAGAHFIQKPFTPRALAAKIREVLEGADSESKDRPTAG